MIKRIFFVSFFIFNLLYGILLFSESDMRTTCSNAASLLFDINTHLKDASNAIEQQIYYTQSLIDEIEESLENLFTNTDQSVCPKEKINLISQELVNTQQQVNTLSTIVKKMNPTTLALELTSMNMDIISHPTDTQKLIIAKPGTNIEYALEKGDHNIWFDKKNNLWGYDKCGRIFVINGKKRKVITLSECCKIFD